MSGSSKSGYRGGTSAIKTHAFFGSLSFEELQAGIFTLLARCISDQEPLAPFSPRPFCISL